MSTETIRSLQEILKESLKYIIYTSIILLFIIPALGPDGYRLGKFFGILALLMFVLTQVPGLIRRFGLGGIFRDIYKILFTSRAQQGILMFMFGLIHYITVYLAPNIRAQSLPMPTGYSLAGITALTIVFLLFITSNIQSKKLLKAWWGRLHKLVFVLSWAIALHLFFIYGYQMSLGYRELSTVLLLGLIMLVGILQITSLAYSKVNMNERE